VLILRAEAQYIARQTYSTLYHSPLRGLIQDHVVADCETDKRYLHGKRVGTSSSFCLPPWRAFQVWKSLGRIWTLVPPAIFKPESYGQEASHHNTLAALAQGENGDSATLGWSCLVFPLVRMAKTRTAFSSKARRVSLVLIRDGELPPAVFWIKRLWLWTFPSRTRRV
jgi:hypothetical protein